MYNPVLLKDQKLLHILSMKKTLAIIKDNCSPNNPHQWIACVVLPEINLMCTVIDPRLWLQVCLVAKD